MNSLTLVASKRYSSRGYSKKDQGRKNKKKRGQKLESWDGAKAKKGRERDKKKGG